MKSRLILALILITQLASLQFAQQPRPTPAPPPQSSPQTPNPSQEPDDVVRITTNLVQVDAVVTDKSGKVVTDLQPEEVQILEDKRPQKITNFSYIVAESPDATRPAKPAPVDKNAPPGRLKPENIRRTIAVVVDDLGLSFSSFYYTRQALKKFVDEQMQPGDLVAIIRTSSGMGALQQFSSDKRQLSAAIERLRYNALGRGGITPFAPLELPTPGSHGKEMDDANDELNQFRDDLFAVGTLGAISYVVKGLRGLPGRKSILLISDGFRIYNTEDSNRNYLALQRLRRLVDEAGRSSVVIYTMNATGLLNMGLSAADSVGERSVQDVEDAMANRRAAAFETQEGLTFLAQQTGGIAIRNNNDLSNGIKKVLDDQRGYYLIGYRPDASTFDARTGRRLFHHLSLKVTRPGKFTVRMRNGFFGVTDEEKPAKQTLAQQLYGALNSPFGATGVHLQLTSLFANDIKAGSYMRSILHIDARDLTFTDEPNGLHQSVFDVLAITFGDNGAPVDQSGRTYTIQLKDEIYKRALRQGLVYYVTVPIKKPGAYQFRLSLRDSTSERIGSANQFIEVPDLKKNRLAISGIVLRGLIPAPRTPAVAPANPAANPAAPDGTGPNQSAEGVGEGNPEASPAVRHFTRGMHMEYVFVIYNARLDKATNLPQLTTQVRLFREGKVVFTGKENPFSVAGNGADLKRLIGAGMIQLGTDMEPGEFVLQVVITDKLADEKHRTVTQWMDFEVK